MIPVRRGPEPQELRRARACRLSRAILARRAGEVVDFSGYDVAKDTLAGRLHWKCSFCEMGLRKEGNPVEHFRPKAKVANDGEPEDPERYWWLAWTWENMLFACFRCNTPLKLNQFPLRRGTAPLPSMSFELAREEPLLIDPSREDPRRHFRFLWSDTRQRWLPTPVDGSLQAYETIRIFHLDEDDVAQRHVSTHVESWKATIERAIERGDRALVQSTWQSMLVALFSPCQDFQALTWDVLDHHFPEATRRGWGVELPEFLPPEPVEPSVIFEDPAELSELAEELQLRVRALGATATENEVSRVLPDVLAQRAWTDEELARLFTREPQTIRVWRQRLASPPSA